MKSSHTSTSNNLTAQLKNGQIGLKTPVDTEIHGYSNSLKSALCVCKFCIHGYGELTLYLLKKINAQVDSHISNFCSSRVKYSICANNSTEQVSRC